MAKTITREDLRSYPLQKRAALYQSACRLGHTPEGAQLKKLIEEAGLPYSEDRCLTNDDPIAIKMYEVIHSAEGRTASLAAVKAGLPAMAGIDPLLQIALGVDYGPHNMATVTAGSLVGDLMTEMGYKKGKQAKLPAHCVAKTAATWI